MNPISVSALGMSVAYNTRSSCRFTPRELRPALVYCVWMQRAMAMLYSP